MLDSPSDIRHPPLDFQLMRLDKAIPITEQSWPEGTVPVVSILCLTFNHGRYIRQALDGFLMQETTFPVEVIVYDDASTDGGQDIVRDYASRHPGLFRLLLQTENQFSRGIPLGAILHESARGEYCACCEGDDYWTDATKLQKQVELLDSRKEAPICFHRILVAHEDCPEKDYISNPEEASVTGVPDIVSRWYTHTNSVVFRRAFLPHLPPWASQVMWTDVSAWLCLAHRGPIHFIPEVLGVYRKHRGGITHGGKAESRKAVINSTKCYRFFNEDTGGQYWSLLRRRLFELNINWAEECRRTGQRADFLRAAFGSLRWFVSQPSGAGFSRLFLGVLLPRTLHPTYYAACRWKNRLLSGKAA